MKTGEMIKELKENPEKKFKSIHEDKSIAPTFAVTRGGGGGILFENFLGEPTPLYYIGFDWKWEEVKEPVGFMDIVENSCKFKLEHEEIDDTCFEDRIWRLDEFLEVLGSEFYDIEIRDILLDGEFYIEEEAQEC